MYSEPQTVTIDATDHELARVPSNDPSRIGSFTTPDGKITLKVTQNKTANRFRREIRLTNTKVASDPISAENKEVSSSIIFTVDEPRWGFGDTHLGLNIAGLLSWLSVQENVDNLLGGEI